MTLSKVVGDLQRLGINRSRIESPGDRLFDAEVLKTDSPSDFLGRRSRPLAGSQCLSDIAVI